MDDEMDLNLDANTRAFLDGKLDVKMLKKRNVRRERLIGEA